MWKSLYFSVIITVTDVIYKLNYQLIPQIFCHSSLQGLQPEGRLHLVLKGLRARDQPDQSLPTSHQEIQPKSFLKNYADALTEIIDAQFQESSPVLDSFKTFELLSVPVITDDGFRYCLLLVL